MLAEKLIDLTLPRVEETEPHLRFTVGEEYIFLIFKASYSHHGPDGKAFWRTIHNPAGDTLHEIRSLKLRCQSRHKVPITYDDDRKGDGYIFVDEATGENYYNQYPRASYGQTDTSGDYHIRKARIESEDPAEVEAFTKLSSDEQDFFMANWKLGTQVAHSLASSIQQLKTNRNEQNADISDPALKSLEDFKVTLEEYLRKNHNVAVKYERVRIKRTDGVEVLTDIVDAEFERIN